MWMLRTLVSITTTVKKFNRFLQSVKVTRLPFKLQTSFHFCNQWSYYLVIISDYLVRHETW